MVSDAADHEAVRECHVMILDPRWREFIECGPIAITDAPLHRFNESATGILIGVGSTAGNAR